MVRYKSGTFIEILYANEAGDKDYCTHPKLNKVPGYSQNTDKQVITQVRVARCQIFMYRDIV